MNWLGPLRLTSPRMAVLLIIGFTGAFRLALGASTGLGVDESYWAVVSRVPSLSYIDDAPLQAWIVHASRTIFQSDHPAVLRLPFILLFAGSTWLMYMLTARLFGSRAAVWAAVAFNLAPIFTIADATWILPDGPLIFFQLAATTLVASILFGDQKGKQVRVGLWVAAGALGGVAMLAKYHAAFFFLAVLIFLLTTPRFRSELLAPGPWLGGIIGLLVFSPVIIWNVQNDWAGLHFQLDRVGGHANPWLGTFRVVGGTLLFLGWLLLPMLVGLIKALWVGPAQPRTWLMTLLALGPIIVFGTVSIWARQQYPHWSMPGWAFVMPLVGLIWVRLEKVQRRLAFWSMAASGAALIAIVVLLQLHMRIGILSELFTALNLRADPTLELHDWTNLRQEIFARRSDGNDQLVVATLHWTEAAKAAYALGADIPVVCICKVPQQFPYIVNPMLFAGKTIFVIGRHLDQRGEVVFSEVFERTAAMEPIRVLSQGRNIVPLMVYRGDGFKPTARLLPR